MRFYATERTQFTVYVSAGKILGGLLVVLCLLAFVFPAAVAHAQEETITYVVRPGDNLTTIAARYATTVSALVSRNGLSNPNRLRVGQQLQIPVIRKPTPSLQNRAQATSAPPLISPTPAPQTPAPTVADPSVTTYVTDVIYTVHPGESLYAIATKYSTTVHAIVARNRLPSFVIFAGQRLIVPAGRPVPPPAARPISTATPVSPAVVTPPSPTPGGSRLLLPLTTPRPALTWPDIAPLPRK